MKNINLSEILPDGSPRYNKLASGAIVDKTIGRIVTREMTSDQARQLVGKRWEKQQAYKDAAASGMLKKAKEIDPSIQTEEGAWGLLSGKQYEALFNSGKPRGDDLMKFGQVIGALPTIADSKMQAIEGEENSPADIAAINLINAITARIEAEQAKPKVIEGEVHDA